MIYHGKKYWQWVAQADVTLARDAKPSQKKGEKPAISSDPVSAKLVVSRVLDENGKVLAQGLLLTNDQLESWQQESALAIAKRLLVASMACVMVWEIVADQSNEVAELRRFLIKLSGRQMRHKQEFSNPALLDGLWVFLSMLEVINAYSADELESFKLTAQKFIDKLV